jgi:hypothetical protein
MRTRFFSRSYPSGPLRVAFGAAERGRIEIPRRATSENVRYGSKTDKPYVNVARPLHPTQRANADASLNVCVGPETDVIN